MASAVESRRRQSSPEEVEVCPHLRAAPLLPLPFGDVLNGAAESDDLVAGVAQRFATGGHPFCFGFPADYLDVAFVWCTSLQGFFNQVLQPLPIFRSEEAHMLLDCM